MENERERLKKFLDTLYAYDQAGGYVPLELAEQDLDQLADFILAEKREARMKACEELDIWLDMNAKTEMIFTGEVRRFNRNRTAALTPKTTIQDVVNGTPEGQAAVQGAMERSAEVMGRTTKEE